MEELIRRLREHGSKTECEAADWIEAAHHDNQAIMEINNGLRDAMLKTRDILNATVK